MELVEIGYLHPLRFPYATLVLFQKKKDSFLRLCMDYWALNKLTVKNNHPLPLIVYSFDQLAEARYFTKLDLHQGYYHIQIAVGDEEKSIITMRYDSYKFLVMLFSITNAPATFNTLINDVFLSMLDRCVMVYLDDILIYNNSLEEHKKHLVEVFELLRQNSLYKKRESVLAPRLGSNSWVT